jgi:pullulanase
LCPTFAQTDPPIPAGEVRIHYFRPDGNYSGWALYTWNASTENAIWCQSEVAITGTDSFGVYFDVTVNPAQGTPVGDLGFIINNCAAGQIKDPGPDQHLQITQFNEAWVIHADATVFTSQPTAQQIANAILGIEQAYWIDRSHLAIQSQYVQSGATYALSVSPTGGLNLTSTGVTG